MCSNSTSTQFPQPCSRQSTNFSLVESGLFPTSEGGMSATSFPHSSFLRVISVVILWSVQVINALMLWSVQVITVVMLWSVQVINVVISGLYR